MSGAALWAVGFGCGLAVVPVAIVITVAILTHGKGRPWPKM